MVLPPGVNERDFASALRGFAGAVGEQWVFSAKEDTDLYRDPYSPYWNEDEERVASAAVAPDTVEQVQELLRVANRYRVPMYCVSTGRNFAFGGAAPVLSGSVVLDLKRMNRVLEVSEHNAYALVEPGVSYFDLYRHIQDRGLRLMIDVPTPGWGSVIGNALDHGVGLTPMRDHFAAQCGMEVVLADGTLLRTGMGAMPGAQTWQQFKYGAGPHIDGIFSQSNFGVVTKMGIWLQPEPEVVRGLRVAAEHHDDVVEMIRILAALTCSNVIDSQFSLHSPILQGYREAEFQRIAGSSNGGSADDWNRYARRLGLPFWELTFSFHGPEPVVDARWAYVVNRYTAIPGVRFADAPTYRFPMSPEARDRVPDKSILGIPGLQHFGGRTPLDPDVPDGHMDLAIVVPMSGAAVLHAFKTMGQEFFRSGVDVGMGAMASFHPRTFMFISSFPITRDDPEGNRRVRAAYRSSIKLAAEHGWGQYRTHAAFMDLTASTYGFNDNALSRFHSAVKDAVDPNGILSPGRYGIWPRHLREGD